MVMENPFVEPKNVVANQCCPIEAVQRKRRHYQTSSGL
ncbi:hypothetical protein JCM19235_4487 [Vibrio maritimus]|uniref:Uncharacterized protein n=1 Tax=Vibrio maritimus TaxID=990268 RepID=A0A090SLK6_9VIBR|nr:hypothetical protein JCM19235_4487 [Vibrio maritimus]